MKVLQLTAHYKPNVGGVETHLNDLVEALIEKNISTFVLTYQPLTAPVKTPIVESSKRLQIIRLPWFKGLFYKLVDKPLWEFIYLLPGLFLVTPFVLIKNSDITVVNAHGLVAGAVGVFWGKLFGKRVIVSLHSIYHFPKSSLYTNFVKMMFKMADGINTLSEQSSKELEDLGFDQEKINVFTYWIDLGRFKLLKDAKQKLGWNNFTVLFVGRLVEEKGVKVLLQAASRWNNKINLAIAGTGPLIDLVKQYSQKSNNIHYLGSINNQDLPVYYSAADLLIIPSIHEEGFGRVILESLACGTPVIGSNRGAIPEAMDRSVGLLVNITVDNIVKSVESLYKNKELLSKLKRNCRKYAQKRYLKENVETIIKTYG